MDRQQPVHEIQLGAVRASIWEDDGTVGPKFRIGIGRVARASDVGRRTDGFGPDDLPLIAEVADMAHLWICQQAELVAQTC